MKLVYIGAEKKLRVGQPKMILNGVQTGHYFLKKRPSRNGICVYPNGIFEEKNERLSALFWKNLTKKLHFFGARYPSKLVYINAKSAFRKILGSIRKKWISQRAGGRLPERGPLENIDFKKF